MNTKLNILIFITLIFIIIACNTTVKKPKNLIDKEKLTKILIDIHITDAILSKYSLFDKQLAKPESLSYYNQIFKKYNITRADLYQSINYYIQTDLKDFAEFYRSIYDSLNKRYLLYDSLERIQLLGNDIWTLEKKYSIQGDTNSFFFKIPAKGQGYYTLRARIRSYPDDLTQFPRIRLFIIYREHISPSNIINIISRDNKWHDYTVKINTDTSLTPEYIAGYLLYHDPRTTYMHMDIKNIMLTYRPYNK